MVGWSRTKGFSLKARARWDLFTHFSTTLPRMEFTPSIGYSFKQKQIYWEVPLLVRFSHRYDGIFSFNAGGGAHMYNSRQADELRHKLEGIENTIPCFTSSTIMVFTTIAMPTYKPMPVSVCFPD